MPRCNALPSLRPGAEYGRHALHADHLTWTEKNCYVDIWIEVLNAVGLEPLAMLPIVSAIDFEGDQWTFFKPSHDELRDLYGVDVQELTVWRPLADHAVECLGAGKLISTESDAFWLPDTAGSDYQRQHAKTTIVLADIDTENETASYFHSAGYFELSGDDYHALFPRTGHGQGPQGLPLFAETIRLDRVVKRSDDDLAAMSRALWKKHLSRRPDENPVTRFAERFARDLPALREQGMAHYHLWAFAGTRQLGAAFELAAMNLRWLAELGEPGLGNAIASFDAISTACKSLILKGARAVNSSKPFDVVQMLDPTAMAWQQGIAALSDHFEVSFKPMSGKSAA